MYFFPLLRNGLLWAVLRTHKMSWYTHQWQTNSTSVICWDNLWMPAQHVGWCYMLLISDKGDWVCWIVDADYSYILFM